MAHLVVSVRRSLVAGVVMAHALALAAVSPVQAAPAQVEPALTAALAAEDGGDDPSPDALAVAQTISDVSDTVGTFAELCSFVVPALCGPVASAAEVSGIGSEVYLERARGTSWGVTLRSVVLENAVDLLPGKVSRDGVTRALERVREAAKRSGIVDFSRSALGKAREALSSVAEKGLNAAEDVGGFVKDGVAKVGGLLD